MPPQPPESEESRSFALPWIASLILIAAFVAGLIWMPPSYSPPTTDAPSNILFAGRFHPILVHAPVGALLLLIVFEMLCLTRRGEEKWGAAALLALWVGSAGAILAVVAGIMLSREGGYVSGNFTLHQTMGIIGTSGVLLSLIVRVHAMTKRSGELLHAYRAIFLLGFGIMGLGAHFGGNMSHGNKYLTEHAPENIKQQVITMEKWMLGFVTPAKPADAAAAPQVAEAPPLAAPPQPKTVEKVPAIPDKTPPPAVVAGPGPGPSGGDQLVFQHVILPLFESKCNKCHNEDKSKGDLRLDSYELAMKGGENGSNIVPGKPDESLTIQRILLPADDDEHMPPDGKEQVTPAELALVRWWIEKGASNTLKVLDAKFPPEAKAAADEILKAATKAKLSASLSPSP